MLFGSTSTSKSTVTALRPYQFELCFTSRIARKSDLVGRSIFVNVMYESHYELNIYMPQFKLQTHFVNHKL